MNGVAGRISTMGSQVCPEKSQLNILIKPKQFSELINKPFLLRYYIIMIICQTQVSKVVLTLKEKISSCKLHQNQICFLLSA